MVKQKKALQTKKPRDRSDVDDSLLLQSAESLGRVIDALRRQLEHATKRLYQPTPSRKPTTSRKTKKTKKSPRR